MPGDIDNLTRQTQTKAMKLLEHAWNYYVQILVHAVERDGETKTFAKCQRVFNGNIVNMQWRLKEGIMI